MEVAASRRFKVQSSKACPEFTERFNVRVFRRFSMLSAIVLLNTERDKTNTVAEALADMDGVTEVYSVAGRYDLAAVVRATDNDQLAKVVTEHIRSVPGITTSETLIAFRVYSRHDLERMFSIGMENM